MAEHAEIVEIVDGKKDHRDSYEEKDDISNRISLGNSPGQWKDGVKEPEQQEPEIGLYSNMRDPHPALIEQDAYHK